MKLQVHVGNTPLLALLDSGSTHNFITPEAAKRASIQSHHDMVSA
jgi:hypothetical protein